MDTSTAINLDNESVRRILQAATQRFARDGYRGASMNAIAREAGVSKSLVHYHFDSKEHLFVEVQLQMLRDLLALVNGLTARTTGSVEGFTRALDAVMAFVEREIDNLRVLIEFHNMAAQNPKIAARLVQFEDRVAELLVEGLLHALGPAHERLVLPPERTVRLLRTLFDGMILELAYAPPGIDVRARVRETFADCKTILTRAMLREVS